MSQNPGVVSADWVASGFVGRLLAVVLALAISAQARAIEAPLDTLGFEGLAEQAEATARLHSVLISVDGEPVYAQVIRGPALDQPVNIKSLSKTLLAAVTGAAIDKGLLQGADQSITELLTPPAGADERVAEITVGNLLTMQAGLGRTSGPNYGEWVTSNNWVNYALTRPFVDEPGGTMLYSTGSYHILSAALTAHTGKDTLTLTRELLGDPLNIQIHPWPRDPQGIYFGGNDMRVSPLALLQIGELYRNGGLHDGRRVLSQEWINQSWQPRTRSRFTNDPYGYGWFETDLAGYTAYYGRGFGGQMLYVIPELAVTAVMISSPEPPGQPGLIQQLHGLLEKFVIPVVR